MLDVDQEGGHAALDDAMADDAYSVNSDQAEFEERDEEELASLGAEDRPSGGASTPYHQVFDHTDSEDESICSVSDDGGADRMERMLGAAQGTQLMPPPSPRTPRDPRLIPAALRAAGSITEVPRSLPEGKLTPLPSTSSRPLLPPTLASGSGAPQVAEPRVQAKVTRVASGSVQSSPVLPSRSTGVGVPQDPEPGVQAQVAEGAPGSDRSSLFFIPEKFKGIIRIEPTSSRMVQDEREWRLAEDHLLSVSTNEKGERE